MRGDLFINDADAFEAWGVNLEDGALSALMSPPPLKGYIESKSRTQHGKSVVTGVNTLYVDERELTITFHIIGKTHYPTPQSTWADPNVPEYYTNTKDAFMAQFAALCRDVFNYGIFRLSTRYEPDVEYTLQYLSCSQFQQFHQNMGKFVLKVCEPNPAERMPDYERLPIGTVEEIITDIREL